MLLSGMLVADLVVWIYIWQHEGLPVGGLAIWVWWGTLFTSKWALLREMLNDADQIIYRELFLVYIFMGPVYFAIMRNLWDAKARISKSLQDRVWYIYLPCFHLYANTHVFQRHIPHSSTGSWVKVSLNLSSSAANLSSSALSSCVLCPANTASIPKS